MKLSIKPPILCGIVSTIHLCGNTMFWSLVLYPISLLKIIVPIKPVKVLCSNALIFVANTWVRLNSFGLNMTRKMDIEYEGFEDLSKEGWYLVIVNHQSGADIPILQYVFDGKIPFLKFFLKQNLIWVPFLGQAWWALDFPFMKRYSKDYIEKHPEKKGKDVEMTRRICKKFEKNPTSILNFVEGTRFTQKKHDKQKSSYKHLLKPRAGGIAFALEALGENFNSLLDVTIVYKNGSPGLWQFLCGKSGPIKVVINKRKVEKGLIGDYENDDQFKKRFQKWLNGIWKEKDQIIERVNSETSELTSSKA